MIAGVCVWQGRSPAIQIVFKNPTASVIWQCLVCYCCHEAAHCGTRLVWRCKSPSQASAAACLGARAERVGSAVCMCRHSVIHNSSGGPSLVSVRCACSRLNPCKQAGCLHISASAANCVMLVRLQAVGRDEPTEGWISNQRSLPCRIAIPKSQITFAATFRGKALLARRQVSKCQLGAPHLPFYRA